MNPQFEKWFKSKWPEANYIGTPFERNMEAAWLEATRQAYEDAIKICDDQRYGAIELGFYTAELNSCIRVLRHRLKELNNGN